MIPSGMIGITVRGGVREGTGGLDGRMIWGEVGKPGYGLYDRALGATYINGLFEACESLLKNK